MTASVAPDPPNLDAAGRMGVREYPDTAQRATGLKTASYTISLPLPSRALSLNGRAHWTTRARETATVRLAAKAAWGEASAWQRPMWDGPCWIEIDWHYRGSAPDTASAIERCKAICDALQDAGLIVDDVQVRGHAVRRHHIGHWEEPRVAVTVRWDE